MDYKVVAILSNGDVEERICATPTDIENFVLSMLRGAETRSGLADVHVTVVDQR